jgi:hypothetical protein
MSILDCFSGDKIDKFSEYEVMSLCTLQLFVKPPYADKLASCLQSLRLGEPGQSFPALPEESLQEFEVN